MKRKSKVVVRLRKRTEGFKGFHGAHHSKKGEKKHHEEGSTALHVLQPLLEILNSQHFVMRELGSAD